MSLCDSIELSQGYSNSITLTQECNEVTLNYGHKLIISHKGSQGTRGERGADGLGASVFDEAYNGTFGYTLGNLTSVTYADKGTVTANSKALNYTGDLLTSVVHELNDNGTNRRKTTTLTYIGTVLDTTTYTTETF